MRGITKHLKIIVILILIQFLLDMLFVYLYPDVTPIRATLIGASAFFILYLLSLTKIYEKITKLGYYIAFLPIYSSALFGALLVQADVVASKSPESGIAHVVILVVTYFIIILFKSNKGIDAIKTAKSRS